MPPKKTADDKFSKGTIGSNDLKKMLITFTYTNIVATPKNMAAFDTFSKSLRSKVNAMAASKQPLVAL
ncbi:hypothetical protein BpHYR1_009042 [Brachionus plicatilis]|uniref:Uncharacterized protein n=1 Tax=Brachionus plicatilis TaxID=10195 RepID=A0A3M7P614_BRAPC|nr:hypothetical protein BpHYR1_009042 [Brachionus plicatilis]